MHYLASVMSKTKDISQRLLWWRKISSWLCFRPHHDAGQQVAGIWKVDEINYFLQIQK